MPNKIPPYEGFRTMFSVSITVEHPETEHPETDSGPRAHMLLREGEFKDEIKDEVWDVPDLTDALWLAARLFKKLAQHAERRKSMNAEFQAALEVVDLGPALSALMGRTPHAEPRKES